MFYLLEVYALVIAAAVLPLFVLYAVAAVSRVGFRYFVTLARRFGRRKNLHVVMSACKILALVTVSLMALGFSRSDAPMDDLDLVGQAEGPAQTTLLRSHKVAFTLGGRDEEVHCTITLCDAGAGLPDRPYCCGVRVETA